MKNIQDVIELSHFGPGYVTPYVLEDWGTIIIKFELGDKIDIAKKKVQNKEHYRIIANSKLHPPNCIAVINMTVIDNQIISGTAHCSLHTIDCYHDISGTGNLYKKTKPIVLSEQNIVKLNILFKDINAYENTKE